MTVAALPRSIDYIEDGVTVAFAVPWRFSEASDVKALRTAIDGTQTTLTIGADYAVAGGDTDAGGTVTVTSPAAAGVKLTIWTDTSRAQTDAYTTSDTFPAATHEAELDRLSMVDQEQDAELARTLRVPRGKTAWAVPAAIATRANRVIGFDTGGEAAVLDGAHLAEIIAPALPQDLRGDPGGNVESVGLFTAIGGMKVPAGTDLISTTGYDTVAVGPARYIADATADAALALAHPRACKADVTGRYFRLLPSPLSGKIPLAAFRASGDALAETAYEAARVYDLAIGGRGVELDVLPRPLADVVAQLHAGAATEIDCEGDSLTYGQDTSDNGQATQINGSSVTRSLYPYPETLQDALLLNQFTVAATVNNLGYPGDTMQQIYERWPSRSPRDLAFLMAFTNDGKTLTVPVETSRYWLRCWIERNIVKGQAAVVMTPPPVNESATEANLGAYRDMMRETAAEYGVLCIETAEQLSGLTDIWPGPDASLPGGDLVHLTSYAYGELGWQLAALFNNRDVASKRFVPGSIWYPHDAPGYGGTLLIDSRAPGGSFVQLDFGKRYFISGYFEDDAMPIVHSYNSSATDVDLVMQYSGNGVGRGVTATELVHHAATDNNQALAGPVLRRGYRTISVLNNGAQTAYLGKVEFASPMTPHLSLGWRKSTALSAVHFPATMMAAIAAAAGAPVYVPKVDYGLPLSALYDGVNHREYRYSARLTITDLGGIAVCKNRQGQTSLQDMLFAFRNGNDLVLRELVGNVNTDTTAVGAFAAGPWTGDIELVNDGQTATVFLDGVSKVTFALSVDGSGNAYIVKGFPTVIARTDNPDTICHSAQVKGHVKGPY